jgi:nodulation protein E
VEQRRIVVTGMGAVSASGLGVHALWDAARLGRSGVGEATFARPAGNRVTLAAHVPPFDASNYIPTSLLPVCDRFAQFAIMAAEEALAQAGLSGARPLGDRTAVIIGTGIGCGGTIDQTHYDFYVLERRADALTVPRVMPNAASSLLSICYGCGGPSFTVSSACASATQAIGLGMWFIRNNVVDRALVGGSEASITPCSFRAWEALRVLTPDYCRPFSRRRNGMVLGEGAAIFILETAEAAEARGAYQLAEIAGYGTTSDGKDIVRADVDGAAAAMRLALADASTTPDVIDYINAHGTGTILNDTVECEAVRQVFGAHAPSISISSTKPIHGHALGAAGALELAITIKAVCDQVAPPTINWLEPDPNCNLDVVPNSARPLPIRAAMSNSFAFGGVNATLVVKRTS